MSTKSVSKKSQKSSLDLVELTGTPTLIISSELQNQIEYLHKKIGKKEWSGPVIYEVVEGNTDDPENLVLKAKGMFLMDIGQGSSTDFEMSDDDTFELTDTYPSLMDSQSRLGLLHSHHDMRVYFSGVDNDELKDNAEDYNGYLSLIVGFNLDYKARMAFITEKKVENITHFSTKNMNDEEFDFGSKEEDSEKVVCYYDCDVQLPIEVQESFEDRYNEVLERKKEAKKKSKRVSGYQGNYPYVNQHNRSQRKMGFQQGNNVGKNNDKENGLDGKYTLADIRSFLCKICSFNPQVQNNALRTMLKDLDSKSNVDVYLHPESVLNIIDECIIETFSENEAKDMNADDQADLLIESIDFLEEEVGDEESLVDESQTAEAARDALEGILDDMLEYMETEQTKQKEDEYNWF